MKLTAAQSCRIVVSGSRLFREVLQRALNLVPGLEVVGEAVGLEDLRHMIDWQNPQWLIVPFVPYDKIPEAIESLLIKYPFLSVLAVAVDGSQVQTRGTRLRAEETFKDLSFDDMVCILHAGSYRDD